MWLKDHCQDNLEESKSCGALYRSRRLRHLLPRPTTSITKNIAPCCVISPSYCSCTNNNTIVFSTNHDQQSSAADVHQSRKADEKHMENIVMSSRWNPTPEQLMALEEMYRRGVRTPSAEEIKLIAAKLRQFGKIEGKNVFYWFQNHKARERQKRRRQPESSTSKKFGNNNETLEGNDHKGFCRKDLEAEDNNIIRFISSKEPADGWRTRLDEGETLISQQQQLQQLSQRKMAKGGAAKQVMELSCRASSNSDILKLNTMNIFVAPALPASVISTTNTTSGEELAQQKMLNNRLNFSIFSSSSSCNADVADDFIRDQDAARDHQTLELFPLQNGGHNNINIANEADFNEFMATMNSNIVPPYQFYEFL